MDEFNKIENLLSQNDLDIVKETIQHFLQDPDYATGEETGISFETLSYGQALPFEIVLRDWKKSLNNGTGGRDVHNGDCYEIYKTLYEDGKLDL